MTRSMTWLPAAAVALSLLEGACYHQELRVVVRDPEDLSVQIYGPVERLRADHETKQGGGFVFSDQGVTVGANRYGYHREGPDDAWLVVQDTAEESWRLSEKNLNIDVLAIRSKSDRRSVTIQIPRYNLCSVEERHYFGGGAFGAIIGSWVLAVSTGGEIGSGGKHPGLWVPIMIGGAAIVTAGIVALLVPTKPERVDIGDCGP